MKPCSKGSVYIAVAAEHLVQSCRYFNFLMSRLLFYELQGYASVSDVPLWFALYSLSHSLSEYLWVYSQLHQCDELSSSKTLRLNGGARMNFNRL